jgi:cbb3-type cytochrome oxidase cytochrome c subunit
MLELDWQELSRVYSTAEVILRGSSVYVSFCCFACHAQRCGIAGLADILVPVIIADASQNAMAGGYTQ